MKDGLHRADYPVTTTGPLLSDPNPGCPNERPRVAMGSEDGLKEWRAAFVQGRTAAEESGPPGDADLAKREPEAIRSTSAPQ